ncbi:MAG: ester cyclase [Candidatus Limnocylindria bacterium]
MTKPTSLEHLFRYMRAFEVAYLTGDWRGLDDHFAGNARHRVEAGGPFGRGGVGRAAVIAGLRAGVDGVDRRFDLRIPEVVEGPIARGDGVWMRFALTLRRAGLPDLRVEGTHLAVLRGGRIEALEERLEPGEAEKASAYLAEHGERLRPPGSPFAPPATDADRELLEAAVGRSLVRCYGAAKSRQDAGAALFLCGEDFSIETVAFGIASRDRKQTEQQLALFFRTFPDYAVTLEGFATGSGRITCWGRARMTFGGDFLGQRATGRTAELPVFCLFACEAGVLRSERFFFDLASLCEQIGVPVADLSAALRPLRAGVAA